MESSIDAIAWLLLPALGENREQKAGKNNIKNLTGNSGNSV